MVLQGKENVLQEMRLSKVTVDPVAHCRSCTDTHEENHEGPSPPDIRIVTKIKKVWGGGGGGGEQIAVVPQSTACAPGTSFNGCIS